MTEGTPKPARGLRIALILSLGFNLLVVGAVVGLVIVGSGRRSDGGMQGLRAVGLGPIMHVLSAEDRAALGVRLRENRSAFAERGRPLGGAIRSFAEAVRSEPFDRDAAETALSAQRQHGAALQAEGHALLLDQIEAMSPEARAALAERIDASLRRMLDRRGDGPGR